MRGVRPASLWIYFVLGRVAPIVNAIGFSDCFEITNSYARRGNTSIVSLFIRGFAPLGNLSLGRGPIIIIVLLLNRYDEEGRLTAIFAMNSINHRGPYLSAIMCGIIGRSTSSNRYG